MMIFSVAASNRHTEWAARRSAHSGSDFSLVNGYRLQSAFYSGDFRPRHFENFHKSSNIYEFIFFEINMLIGKHIAKLVRQHLGFTNHIVDVSMRMAEYPIVWMEPLN